MRPFWKWYLGRGTVIQAREHSLGAFDESVMELEDKDGIFLDFRMFKVGLI